jgi:hypothetical protein
MCRVARDYEVRYVLYASSLVSLNGGGCFLSLSLAVYSIFAVVSTQNNGDRMSSIRRLGNESSDLGGGASIVAIVMQMLYNELNRSADPRSGRCPFEVFSHLVARWTLVPMVAH